jgi:hypothetical protein
MRCVHYARKLTENFWLYALSSSKLYLKINSPLHREHRRLHHKQQPVNAVQGNNCSLKQRK